MAHRVSLARGVTPSWTRPTCTALAVDSASVVTASTSGRTCSAVPGWVGIAAATWTTTSARENVAVRDPATASARSATRRLVAASRSPAWRLRDRSVPAGL